MRAYRCCSMLYMCTFIWKGLFRCGAIGWMVAHSASSSFLLFSFAFIPISQSSWIIYIFGPIERAFERSRKLHETRPRIFALYLQWIITIFIIFKKFAHSFIFLSFFSHSLIKYTFTLCDTLKIHQAKVCDHDENLCCRHTPREMRINSGKSVWCHYVTLINLYTKIVCVFANDFLWRDHHNHNAFMHLVGQFPLLAVIHHNFFNHINFDLSECGYALSEDVCVAIASREVFIFEHSTNWLAVIPLIWLGKMRAPVFAPSVFIMLIFSPLHLFKLHQHNWWHSILVP